MERWAAPTGPLATLTASGGSPAGTFPRPPFSSLIPHPSSLIPHPSSLIPHPQLPQPADVYRLGRVPYRAAWALQTRLRDRLVAAKRAGPPDAERPPHAVLVVEHPPVFTLGTSASRANVLVAEAGLAARGAELVETDRGGDVTFHGPGQVVAYPVLDLDRLHTPEGARLRDLHRYLRELEEAVIRTCAEWGVGGTRVTGRTGVWIGPDGRGPERKVCAFGVRCSRWVTTHGLALNVETDLGWFDLVVPCGIADRGVTSLARETGGPVGPGAVADRLLAHLAHRLGLDAAERDPAEAWAVAGLAEPTAGAEAG